eukprot:gene10007-10161_t
MAIVQKHADDPTKCAVYRRDLSSNPNLNSTLPPGWAGLPALRQLHLDHCNISGNQQMCGELQQSSVNVQKALTGIGQQCKVAYSMPLVTGVVVGRIYEHGRSVLSPFHIMQEVSTSSLVPELNQSMTQSRMPKAGQRFPNAVGAFAGAGPPVTADEQQQIHVSSPFESICTEPSPSGSPTGSDVAASSPRGMAALLAVGGSSEASTPAAAEGAASTCTKSDELITAPNGSCTA